MGASLRHKLWIAFLAYRGLGFIILYPIVLIVAPLLISGQPGKGAYILLLMAGYWTTEVIPIYVTALFPILLGPLLGVLPSNSITVAYMKDTNMLFLGGVLVACAIEHRRLHRRIAITVLKLVGSDPKMLILGFMLPTWFLSMWMSNTATTAMMVTIVEAVLVSLNSIEENVEQNVVTDRETPSKHSSSRFIRNTYNLNGNVYNAENQMTLEPASILTVDLSETTDEPPENKLKTNELTGDMADSIETVRKLNKALSLCVCYASTCGGIGTVTGTAPNSIFFGQVNSLFGSDTGLTFSTWMAFACPISVILLLLVWCWLTVRYFGLRSCFGKSRNEKQCEFIEKIIAREADSLGTFNYAEGMCCVLFALLTTLWVTRNVGEFGWGKYFKNTSGQNFVTDTQPAILVALLALILPAVNPVQLYRRQSDNRGGATALANLQDQFLLPWHVAQKRCPWGVFIILGGGYALSDICQNSGLSTLIGQTLSERFGGLSTTALIFVCCLISACITEFTSNAATVSILLPIIFSLGSSLGLHPFLLALPTTIGTSFAFSLPAATPPNSIVFGKGRISVKDMVQSGIPLNILGCLITLAATVTYAQPLFGLDKVPEWAVNRTLTSFPN